MTIKLRTQSWPHFVKLLEAFPHRGPHPHSFWMGDGYIEARSTERGVCLNGVYVNPSMRGMGLGTRYMKDFLAVIDAYGGEIFIAVEAFGDPRGLTNGQLRQWYRRLGFVPRAADRDQNYMMRPAKISIAA